MDTPFSVTPVTRRSRSRVSRNERSGPVLGVGDPTLSMIGCPCQSPRTRIRSVSVLTLASCRPGVISSPADSPLLGEIEYQENSTLCAAPLRPFSICSKYIRRLRASSDSRYFLIKISWTTPILRPTVQEILIKKYLESDE